MALLQRVEITARSLMPFAELFGAAELERVADTVRALGQRLKGGVVWNISSTPYGGGVAELLRSIVGYARGAGVDCRWVVIGGESDFFRLTKRLHNALHGGDDAAYLDASARELYDRVIHANAGELLYLVQPGDVVLVHDPQPAGLLAPLQRHGAHVIWRCHIGTDHFNANTQAAWQFLAPYVAPAEAVVFTRDSYVPAELRGSRVVIIPPTIDPASPKNQPMTIETARAILVETGILEGPMPDGHCPCFTRDDGSRACVRSPTDTVRLGRGPSQDTPLAVQISRWDRLKDPIGVMRGFALFAESGSHCALILAGPNVHAVADDPEGAEVFAEVIEAYRSLPQGVRQRVQLASLPMGDAHENAAIVNALQTQATVVIQKSLEEGFGLTVSEAMWKGKPVIGSRVGGIQDQIEHERSGLLLDNPRDPHELARALCRLIDQPEWAAQLGQAAHQRVREHFLSLHSLYAYAAVIMDVLGPAQQGTIARVAEQREL